jgi:NAD(P)H dehydrogenase (quinone)
MSDVNVLVVFYSRYGTAEQLGLAAGLGAIQARANIRLRRLPDLADPATISATPAWKQNLDRMNRDYVAPRPADPVWADVVVLATPADSPREVESYCESLGPMAGKIAAPLAPGSGTSALKAIYGAAAGAGLIVVPAPAASDDQKTAAREHGYRVTELARTLKSRQAQPPPART